jgi:hypothetical protein|tara:strand:- start:490 stop:711 length:222 start_codon:yes stop_codon:yes gene_type:complete
MMVFSHCYCDWRSGVIGDPEIDDHPSADDPFSAVDGYFLRLSRHDRKLGNSNLTVDKALQRCRLTLVENVSHP